MTDVGQGDQDPALVAQSPHLAGLGQGLAEAQPLDLVGVGRGQAVAGLDLDQPEDGELGPVLGLEDGRGAELRKDALARLDVGRDHGEAGRHLAQGAQAVVELVVAGAEKVEAQAAEDLDHRLAGRIVAVDDRVAREVVAGGEVEDVGAGLPLRVEDGRDLGEGVDLAVHVVGVEDDDARLARCGRLDRRGRSAGGGRRGGSGRRGRQTGAGRENKSDGQAPERPGADHTLGR